MADEELLEFYKEEVYQSNLKLHKIFLYLKDVLASQRLDNDMFWQIDKVVGGIKENVEHQCMTFPPKEMFINILEEKFKGE